MDKNRKLVLLISGPIAVGKSSIVSALTDKFGLRNLSSGNYLKNIAISRRLKADRATLTRIGDEMDLETDYAWVVDKVLESAMEQNPLIDKWVFDSVRKKRQVFHFRDTFPNLVVHIHFVAEERTLRDRYNSRNASKDNRSYEIAVLSPNEKEARSLREIADHIFDTNDLNPCEIAKDVMELLYG